jgi:hypothetical protein
MGAASAKHSFEIELPIARDHSGALQGIETVIQQRVTRLSTTRHMSIDIDTLSLPGCALLFYPLVE